MDSREKEARRIIKEQGGVYVRQKTHEMWKFPDGTAVSLPVSCCCPRVWQNVLAELRVRFHLHDPDRGAEGVRREKKATAPPLPEPEVQLTAPALPTMRDGLQAVKVPPKKKVIRHPEHHERRAELREQQSINLSGLEAWAKREGVRR